MCVVVVKFILEVVKWMIDVEVELLVRYLWRVSGSERWVEGFGFVFDIVSC